MALETLVNVREIDGFDVCHFTEGSEKNSVSEEDLAKYKPAYIWVDHEQNTITFKIQNGPIKENGVNGCQVDQLISAAKLVIEGLDKNFPSFDNQCAIHSLSAAKLALENRKREREARGVEGFNKE